MIIHFHSPFDTHFVPTMHLILRYFLLILCFKAGFGFPIQPHSYRKQKRWSPTLEHNAPTQRWAQSLISLHKDLVNIESITGHEQKICDFLIDYLAARIFTVETQIVTPLTEDPTAKPRQNDFANKGPIPSHAHIIDKSHWHRRSLFSIWTPERHWDLRQRYRGRQRINCVPDHCCGTASHGWQDLGRRRKPIVCSGRRARWRWNKES